MTWHGVEVIDGLYQVYATEDSIRRRPVGRPFDRPRLAVDFANALDAGAVYVSPLREPSREADAAGVPARRLREAAHAVLGSGPRSR